MKYRTTTGGGAPLACQHCLKWLCGDPAPTRYRSLEPLTYGWIYCSPECIEHNEYELRVRALLAKVYLPEGVELWLNGYHRGLGAKPMELISAGDGERVFHLVQSLAYGTYL